jgi:hypothetical protein
MSADRWADDVRLSDLVSLDGGGMRGVYTAACLDFGTTFQKVVDGDREALAIMAAKRRRSGDARRTCVREDRRTLLRAPR